MLATPPKLCFSSGAQNMENFSKVFRKTTQCLLGMVHLRALPGTPKNNTPVQKIVDIACEDAQIYKDLNLDGIIVENMHDVPYVHSRDVGPEITASMAVICKEVKRTFGSKPVGVQILAGANLQALAVAKAAGLQFVRMEGFVFSHVADEGWMDACAGEVLRYRKSLEADDIMIFTDIKKKHSAHTVTSDVSISETASAAEFFLSDGVIVTGSSTGKAADIQDLKDVQNSVSIPVLIGSGVTSMNFDLYKSANGVIVGSHFKKNGKWKNEIDRGRIEEFITTATK